MENVVEASVAQSVSQFPAVDTTAEPAPHVESEQSLRACQQSSQFSTRSCNFSGRGFADLGKECTLQMPDIESGCNSLSDLADAVEGLERMREALHVAAVDALQRLQDHEALLAHARLAWQKACAESHQHGEALASDALQIVGDSQATLSSACDMQDALSTKSSQLHSLNPITRLSWQKAKNLTCRGKLRYFVRSLEFQIFMLVVIAADGVASMLELIHSIEEGSDLPYWHDKRLSFTQFALALCSVELGAKIIGFGCRNFCRDSWSIIDAVVVIAAWTFSILPKALPHANLIRMFGRMVWATRICRLQGRWRPLLRATKARVSQNTHRYVDIENNFDLDLTYITNNMIAMSVPCVSPVHGLYRNPMWEVKRFFALHHKKGFRVYNACPELPYPDESFESIGGRIVRFEIQDHTPPTMKQFIDFLRDVREVLNENRYTTIAVHCRGGKGRTGSLCCAWLLYSRTCKCAREALRRFAEQRTNQDLVGKLRGVETPSQLRYVNQLAQHLDTYRSYRNSPFPPPFCAAPSIKLRALDFEGGVIARPQKVRPLKVLIQSGGPNISELSFETGSYDPGVRSIALNNVEVSGDVRVSVFQDRGNGFSASQAMASAANAHKAKGLVLLFIFHTNFMQQPRVAGSAHSPGRFKVPVEELDVANRRIKSGRHAAGSSVVLRYVALLKDPCPEPDAVSTILVARAKI